jgi:hypothetical protein
MPVRPAARPGGELDAGPLANDLARDKGVAAGFRGVVSQTARSRVTTSAACG